MIRVEDKLDLKEMDIRALDKNIVMLEAIDSGVSMIENEDHLYSIVASVFNMMVMNLPLEEMEPFDLYKVNMLGLILEGRMNLEAASQGICSALRSFKEERERRNASS